jgi:hypothetical protein
VDTLARSPQEADALLRYGRLQANGWVQEPESRHLIEALIPVLLEERWVSFPQRGVSSERPGEYPPGREESGPA